MPKINEEQRVQLTGILEKNLVDPVGIILFIRQDGAREGMPAEPTCEYCSDVLTLMSEFVDLSNRLSLEVLDFDEDRDEAEKYGVKRVPAIIPLGKEDYGIRYFGMPAGYEFAAFLQTLLNISNNSTQLSDDSLEAILSLSGGVDIKVFVTTTCPYCPQAASLVYQLAMASNRITAEIYEAAEFPDLVEAYNVDSVPRTLLNDEVSLVGALPEDEVVDEVVKASQRRAA